MGTLLGLLQVRGRLGFAVAEQDSDRGRSGSDRRQEADRLCVVMRHSGSAGQDGCRSLTERPRLQIVAPHSLLEVMRQQASRAHAVAALELHPSAGHLLQVMQRQEADRAREAADRAAEEREERATRQHYAELQQKEAARQQQQMEAERLPGPLGGLCQPALQLAGTRSTCEHSYKAWEQLPSNPTRSSGRARSGVNLNGELVQCPATTLRRHQLHSMRGPRDDVRGDF